MFSCTECSLKSLGGCMEGSQYKCRSSTSETQESVLRDAEAWSQRNQYSIIIFQKNFEAAFSYLCIVLFLPFVLLQLIIINWWTTTEDDIALYVLFPHTSLDTMYATAAFTLNAIINNIRQNRDSYERLLLRGTTFSPCVSYIIRKQRP